ncbi:Solute carrier family 23 member 2 [Holothuria leucospilota]|uniref:Solute carrier family 23 member 2 n=1 Tax=Holothuria leucospilota TaxID=206669 RepID=A0A9Q1CLR8_HOLLE|nr:Solute carrier family 23 member 2 [Holothuria leucospilota]
MFAAIVCGIIESVGDYYACAMISGVPPPPVHAINRGVGIEGLGCLAAGFWGSGAGYTSYSNNIAAVGLTKIASRVFIYFCALIFLLCGIFAKFSAFCAALPQPIIGAMMATTFGMVASIGFANLRNVNVSTSRNLFILGLSLFFGIGLPDYLTKNPDAINTGSTILDQVLTVVLGSSMLIGGFSACVLDNIIRGTPEEKGMHFQGGRWTRTDGEVETSVQPKCYDLPFGMDWIRKRRWTSLFPFSPPLVDSRKLLFAIVHRHIHEFNAILHELDGS